ncbi:hypothetical protein [Hirschia litorea]|uniref:Uncharacterized protein n=1 Tax=Hirschia litorea TaxID=1199156 RepID=A0ABW2IHP0_9PROT
MILSPTLFLTAVSGVIKLGKAARNARRDQLLQQDFSVLTNNFPIHDNDEIEWMAVDFVYRRKDLHHHCEPSGELDTLFTKDSLLSGDAMELLPVCARQRKQVATCVDILYDAVRSEIPESVDSRIIRNASMDPRIQYIHREWLSNSKPTGWARFGLELADVALDVIGTQPEVLGFDRKAENILNALIPNLDGLVDRIKLDGGGAEGFGERLVKTFVHSALVSVSQHPELITSEERWRPMITGVIEPLKLEVEQSEGLEFLAHEKLTRVLTGPMAHGALTAINNNADAFFKGDARSEKLMGVITRTVLADAVSIRPNVFNVVDALSEVGVLKIYDAALKTASARPELFMRGASLETNSARQFLQNMAGVMQNMAPPPFDIDSGFGAEVISAAFQVAGEYGTARIQAKAGDANWDGAWADIYSHLFADLMQGLKIGVSGGGRDDVLAQIFTRDQAVDLLKVMAGHIASNPHMATGRSANSEVKEIARVAAAAISSDDLGLLNAQDWRSVVSVMTMTAARNPGVLFSVDASEGVSHEIGLTLVQHVLSKAGTLLQAEGRRAGSVLFGETLREALMATIKAANANLVRSLTVQDENGQRAHVQELGKFIDKLNAVSSSEDTRTTMNADEWLYVYKYFVAHILEFGPGAVDQISVEDIVEALRGDALSYVN